MDDTDLNRTAVHEAGHAVIAAVLDIAVGHVTIVADYESAGHHIIPKPLPIEDAWDGRGISCGPDAALRARILPYLAEAETQIAVFGVANQGGADDRWQITPMIDSMVPAGQDVGPITPNPAPAATPSNSPRVQKCTARRAEAVWAAKLLPRSAL